MRSRPEAAAIPASTSPDFSSLALASTSLMELNWKVWPNNVVERLTLLLLSSPPRGGTLSAPRPLGGGRPGRPLGFPRSPPPLLHTGAKSTNQQCLDHRGNAHADPQGTAEIHVITLPSPDAGRV